MHRPFAPANPYSERTSLAYQYRKGNGMDDDTDESQWFRPRAFSIGSTKDTKFLKGFESKVHTGHSRLSFNYDRRWIYIYLLPTTLASIPPAFAPLEAEIPFEDIVTGGLRLDIKGSEVTLTVTTRRPPRFYAKLPGLERMRRATERDFVFQQGPMQSTKGRSLDEMLARGFVVLEGHAGPIMSVPEDLTIEVGSWLTYRFHFTMEQPILIKRRVERLGLEAKQDGIDLLSRINRSLVDKSVPAEAIPHIRCQSALDNISQFRIRFLVEGLVTHAIIIPSEIRELVAAIKHHSPQNLDLQERVLTALFNEERVRNIDRLVAIRSKQLRRKKVRVEAHQVWIYRCMVTPTRILLFPAEQETSNDVLRKHRLHVDRFLRVQFTDEDDRIQINPTVKSADDSHPAVGTIARVRRALNSGLTIAGRHYVFLAAGTSQAREHSCWFLSEEKISAEDVRRTMGMDGIKEKIVAKYAARMGLPFSTTRAVSIECNIRKARPDIFTNDKAKLCFTDGAGTCGIKVARQAAREFGITSGIDANPSALQIRIGGTKGVLAVWPDLMHSHDVRFRPSMIKFETNARDMAVGLNVVRIAQYHRAFLNRQFIILLDYLGVTRSVVTAMFDEAVRKTRGISRRFTERSLLPDDLRAASLSTFPLKDLAEAGFNNDPCFRNVSKVLETRILTDLKWKNRLEIAQGVYLMGIPDELNVLNEGEVFCQYQYAMEPGNGPTLVTGTCAIMRAPALHLGDIRLVRAVDHPKLCHLVNVIVFPVRGYRPLPNMLAGGDLDGDDYTLIWDKRLLPKFEAIPADYTPPTPVKVNDVTIENVKDFFIDYIRNDILGQVSNAHLSFADDKGPNSKECLELARQASIAVDFPKTGVPAELRPKFRPRQWPTFMGKDVNNSSGNNYKSQKILGLLFDLVHPDPEYTPIDITKIPDFIDPRLMQYKIPPGVLDEAYRLKEDYDVHMMGLMNRYRVTEAEVICGIILKNPKRRRGRDGDIKEPVTDNYQVLQHNVIEHAQSYLAKRGFKTPLRPLQIFAIAAYQITYSSKTRKEVENRMGRVEEEEEEVEPAAPMISFAWVMAQELVDLPNITRIDLSLVSPGSDHSSAAFVISDEGAAPASSATSVSSVHRKGSAR